MKFFFISFFLLFFSNTLISQTKKEVKHLSDKADSYFDEKLYLKAYQTFDKLVELDPKNKSFYYLKKGQCAAFIPSKKAESIQILEDLYTKDTSEITILFYLAEAYHHNYMFDKALEFISRFKQLNNDPDMEEAASLLMLNARNGKELIKDSVHVMIKNIGPPVNTSEAEYVPVVTPDNTMMIFTYRGSKSTGGLMDQKFNPDPEGEYYEDVYYSLREGNAWSVPKSMGGNINTKHNDAAIAISHDKKQLYTFYSSETNGGDIFVCNRNGDFWEKPVPLGPTINSSEWEGSCSVSGDGTQLYFASERPGGYGGKDIYVSNLLENGEWGPAINLGPIINTKYDDDSPYIDSKGITLFFSTQGHYSIGGFDIHFTMREDNTWTKPQNLGFPVNTTDDDIYYIITDDGKQGYYSSTRDDKGGTGNHDIYLVDPGIIGEPPAVALLTGGVYDKIKSLKAQISFIKKSNGELVGPITTQSITDLYYISLTPGETYVAKIVSSGYPEREEEFTIPNSTTFLDYRKDFYLTSDSLAAEDTLKLAVKNPCENAPVPDFSPFKGKNLNDPSIYRKLIDLITSICESKIIYRVQIAAYRHPENYSWTHLSEFGAPETQTLNDGITRFTQGRFTAIREAEAQRQKAIARGQKDAWITALIDGKRFTLEELIQNDFFLAPKEILK